MALVVGGHAFGRCHVSTSGFIGPWASAPNRYMAAEYIQRVLSVDTAYRWRVDNTNSSLPAYWAHKTALAATAQGVQEPLMLLPTDAVMGSDPRFKKILQAFATDVAGFNAKFAFSFAKLLANGVPTPAAGPALPPLFSLSARTTNASQNSS